MNRTLGQLLRAIIKKNLKSREECFPHIEFAYNRSVHSSTHYSPFEIVYGFNLLTPLDLSPLLMHEYSNLDGAKKLDFVKQFYEKVRQNIEKRNEQTANHHNKGRRQVVFEPGDWVWLHMHKERFPSQRHSKLQPRGDGPFQVVARISDNAYKFDLPSKYNVSATFNVADLSPFDFEGADSRMNPLEERGNDVISSSKLRSKDPQASQDPLQVQQGPMTRSKTKKIQEALLIFIQGVWKAQELPNTIKINKEAQIVFTFTTSKQVNLE